MAQHERPGESRRLPNGEGTVYYGNDGRWHGRVTVGVRDDGRPDRRHVTGRSEAAVRTKIRNLERARNTGNLAKAGETWTVEKWLQHWYENIASPVVRYKTQGYYRTAVEKYLVPGIGGHKLDHLEPEHIERMYSRLRKKGAKPATLQQVHIALRAALNEAERRGKLTGRNPIRAVRGPRMEETEIEPLTVNDVKAVLRAAHGRRNGVRWAVALAMGLRQGEALGLKWPDLTIEWHHGCPDADPCGEEEPNRCAHAQVTGMFTVRRALQRQVWQHGCTATKPCGKKRGADCPRRHSGGLVAVKPKSRAGNRVVSVPTPLVHALLEHQEQQAKERADAGELWHDEDWVFAQPDGRPTDPRADWAEWKDVLKAANVREARLHDARHTAATFLLVLGVGQRAVMDVMGWSQVRMTERYQHVPDELRRNIANRLDGLLWDDPDRRREDGADGPEEKG